MAEVKGIIKDPVDSMVSYSKNDLESLVEASPRKARALAGQIRDRLLGRDTEDKFTIIFAGEADARYYDKMKALPKLARRIRKDVLEEMDAYTPLSMIERVSRMRNCTQWKYEKLKEVSHALHKGINCEKKDKDVKPDELLDVLAGKLDKIKNKYAVFAFDMLFPQISFNYTQFTNYRHDEGELKHIPVSEKAEYLLEGKRDLDDLLELIDRADRISERTMGLMISIATKSNTQNMLAISGIKEISASSARFISKYPDSPFLRLFARSLQDFKTYSKEIRQWAESFKGINKYSCAPVLLEHLIRKDKPISYISEVRENLYAFREVNPFSFEDFAGAYMGDKSNPVFVSSLKAAKDRRRSLKKVREEIQKVFRTKDEDAYDMTPLLNLMYHTKESAESYAKPAELTAEEEKRLDKSYGKAAAALRGSTETIIDLGCGNGLKAAYFFKKTGAKDLVLVDESQPMLDNAAATLDTLLEDSIKKRIEDIQRSDFSQYHGKTFLFLGNTLANLPEPLKVLNNLVRCMEEGDRLVLEVDKDKDAAEYDNPNTMNFLSYNLGLTESEKKTFKVTEEGSSVVITFDILHDRKDSNLRKGKKIRFVSGSYRPARLADLLRNVHQIEPLEDAHASYDTAWVRRLYKQKGRKLPASPKDLFETLISSGFNVYADYSTADKNLLVLRKDSEISTSSEVLDKMEEIANRENT